MKERKKKQGVHNYDEPSRVANTACKTALHNHTRRDFTFPQNWSEPTSWRGRTIDYSMSPMNYLQPSAPQTHFSAYTVLRDHKFATLVQTVIKCAASLTDSDHPQRQK